MLYGVAQYLEGVVSSYMQSEGTPEEQFLFDPMSVVGIVSALETLDYKIGLLWHKITLHAPGSGGKRRGTGDSRDRSAEYILPAILSSIIIYPPKQDEVLHRIYNRLIKAICKNLEMYESENKEANLPPLKSTDKVVKIYNQITSYVKEALTNPEGKREQLQPFAYDKRLCKKIVNNDVWKKEDITALDKMLQSLAETDSIELKKRHLSSIKMMRDEKFKLFVPLVTGYLEKQKVLALQSQEGSSQVKHIEIISNEPEKKSNDDTVKDEPKTGDLLDLLGEMSKEDEENMKNLPVPSIDPSIMSVLSPILDNKDTEGGEGKEEQEIKFA